MEDLLHVLSEVVMFIQQWYTLSSLFIVSVLKL